MNSKIIIGVFASVLLLGALLWFVRSGTSDTAAVSLTSGSALSAEETYFDFGTISMAAGNVSHAFWVKNAGSEPVVLEKMYTSCMCTSASFLKDGKVRGPYGMPGHNSFIPKISETLGPDEEAVIEAVFDPAAHGPAGVGLAERSVYIETNSAESPTLELTFRAEVTR
ncbi:MAG: DUF1573 domain-containing protein [Candidatus Niyogibacteria bacterium]|nr:DUF1573 domain-containing protein [Candidatus Niyogibacteria bacterium]